MGEVFVAELRDEDVVEKRYRVRIVAMRRDKHLITSGRADYRERGSPASWWRRLKKDLQRIRRRNKNP
jgi:hypothetical protein